MDLLPERLHEKGNKSYNPGDIIYVDSNFIPKYDCFGVVIDRDFWIEQVEKEDVFKESLEEILENGVFEKSVLFRVLGTKSFRQYKKPNSLKESEPDNHAIMHYKCQLLIYVDPVNLRPLIEISKKNNCKIGELLFNESDSYISGALNDAEVVYKYLDGERFNPKKEHYSKEDKLLKLLEKAIPLNNQQP